MALLLSGLGNAQAEQANNGRFEYFFEGARSLTIRSESSIDGILGLSFEEARGGILAITTFPLLSRGGDGLEAWSPLSGTRWLASREEQGVPEEWQPGPSIRLITGNAPSSLLPRDTPSRLPDVPVDFSDIKIGAGGSLSLGGGRPPATTPPRVVPPGGQFVLANPGGISIDNGGTVFGESPNVGLSPNVMPAVPEPAPLLMFSVGSLLLLARRRFN